MGRNRTIGAVMWEHKLQGCRGPRLSLNLHTSGAVARVVDASTIRSAIVALCGFRAPHLSTAQQPRSL